MSETDSAAPQARVQDVSETEQPLRMDRQARILHDVPDLRLSLDELTRAVRESRGPGVGHELIARLSQAVVSRDAALEAMARTNEALARAVVGVLEKDHNPERTLSACRSCSSDHVVENGTVRKCRKCGASWDEGEREREHEQLTYGQALDAGYVGARCPSCSDRTTVRDGANLKCAVCGEVQRGPHAYLSGDGPDMRLLCLRCNCAFDTDATTHLNLSLFASVLHARCPQCASCQIGDTQTGEPPLEPEVVGQDVTPDALGQDDPFPEGSEGAIPVDLSPPLG